METRYECPGALELTLQWYKTYYQDKGFISDLTEQQIQYFFSK